MLLFDIFYIYKNTILLILTKSALVPAGIYLLKVNSRNIRTRCEICSKLTIKTLERRQWRSSVIFIVKFTCNCLAGWGWIQENIYYAIFNENSLLYPNWGK